MYMSCVPHVMYGLVFVVKFAVALLRICMTKSNVRFCYQICDKKHSTWVTLSRCRGEAHFPFRCAPRRLVMRRYQVRFHHAAATAHSQRGKCKLPASPANKSVVTLIWQLLQLLVILQLLATLVDFNNSCCSIISNGLKQQDQALAIIAALGNS